MNFQSISPKSHYSYCWLRFFIKNIGLLKGRFNINKTKNTIPNIVTNGNEQWVPFAYVTGNPLNLQSGIASIQKISGGATMIQTYNSNTTYEPSTLGIWLNGGNTYFAIPVNPVPETAKIGNAFINIWCIVNKT